VGVAVEQEPSRFTCQRHRDRERLTIATYHPDDDIAAWDAARALRLDGRSTFNAADVRKTVCGLGMCDQMGLSAYNLRSSHGNFYPYFHDP
jgi:hypothetical protein